MSRTPSPSASTYPLSSSMSRLGEVEFIIGGRLVVPDAQAVGDEGKDRVKRCQMSGYSNDLLLVCGIHRQGGSLIQQGGVPCRRHRLGQFSGRGPG